MGIIKRLITARRESKARRQEFLTKLGTDLVKVWEGPRGGFWFYFAECDSCGWHRSSPNANDLSLEAAMHTTSCKSYRKAEKRMSEKVLDEDRELHDQQHREAYDLHDTDFSPKEDSDE